MKRVCVSLCNKVYKPLVLKMRDLVETKTDWDDFSDSEKTLVENNILIVQILQYLNNVALFKVTKYNDNNEVEEVVSNAEEVDSALKKAKNGASRLEVS